MGKKKRILIVIGFPTYGAGTGVLVTTQAKTYVEDGHKVTIVTSNNKTDFSKIEGVKYHIVPFTGEKENSEVIEKQLPFNFPIFATHTESTKTFWSLTYEEYIMYRNAFEEAVYEEITLFKPDVIHAQHNWISSSVTTEFSIPVVLTIHGTDLMAYEKAETELKRVSKIINDEKIDEVSDLLNEKKKLEKYMEEAKNSAKNSKKIIVVSEEQRKEFSRLFPNDISKLELVENGYDPRTFYINNNVNKEEVLRKLIPNKKEEYDKIALFVGRLTDCKGIDAVLCSSKLYEENLGKERTKNNDNNCRSRRTRKKL